MFLWLPNVLKSTCTRLTLDCFRRGRKPMALMHDYARPHHQASFEYKILCIYSLCAWVFFSTLLPWELRKTLQHLLFQNEAWCTCSSDVNVHQGLFGEREQHWPVQTCELVRFQRLNAIQAELPFLLLTQEVKWRFCSRKLRVYFFSVKHFFLSLNFAIMWPLKA